MVHCPFKKVLFLCLVVFLAQNSLLARNTHSVQVDYAPEDQAIFDRYVCYITPYRNLPLNEVIIQSGKFFLDVPYVAATLEKEPERLVVNLRELDCTTFVETVLALSRAAKGEELTFDSFQENLQQIRYRNGVIDGYTSRLHYMTDWIGDNTRLGIVEDVTGMLGGKPFKPALSFMSSHPESYQPLVSDPGLVRDMREIEKRINESSHSWYYIPKQEAAQHLTGLQNGDIVMFTTRIAGLDVTHLGFIYREGDKVTFIHASTGAKKVVINEAPLTEYMTRINSNTGMMIVRPSYPAM